MAVLDVGLHTAINWAALSSFPPPPDWYSSPDATVADGGQTLDFAACVAIDFYDRMQTTDVIALDDDGHVRSFEARFTIEPVTYPAHGEEAYEDSSIEASLIFEPSTSGGTIAWTAYWHSVEGYVQNDFDGDYVTDSPPALIPWDPTVGLDLVIGYSAEDVTQYLKINGTEYIRTIGPIPDPASQDESAYLRIWVSNGQSSLAPPGNRFSSIEIEVFGPDVVEPSGDIRGLYLEICGGGPCCT